MFEPIWLVKRVGQKEFEVAKFHDGKQPSSVYGVIPKPRGMYFTNAPSFGRMQQNDKHIRLVEQFIAEGEPEMRVFKFDGENIV